MLRPSRPANREDLRHYALALRGVTPAPAEHFVDSRNEVIRGRGRGNRATQNGLIGNVFAVIRFCVGCVLVNLVAGQVDPSNKPLLRE